MKPLLKLFTICTLFFIPLFVHAQGCVMGQDPGCDPDVSCPCPIDNGVYILIIAAVGLAAWRSFRAKKNQAAV